MNEVTQPEAADQQSYDFSTDPDGVTLEDLQYADPFLEVVLSTALGFGEAKSDASFGLTVSLGGTVVSGQAITMGTWAELLGSALTEAHQPLGETFTIVTDQLMQDRDEIRKRRKVEDRPLPARAYLHMKDVAILSGGATEPLRLATWRGKMREITSWSVGSLTS